MTGYTVHTGSTMKFAAGWDEVFAKPAKSKRTPKKSAAKSAKKSVRKPTQKKAGKKRG
jgi:hypothetical protein